ncbi:putative membrane protein [Burkholderia thailandensis USAMRU Malaysia |nr:putative membrane protein [Burkholderia thailandensis E444]AIC90101.1 putative membrane protein [Burkholderia thailandensis USAMRU Malaysia \
MAQVNRSPNSFGAFGFLLFLVTVASVIGRYFRYRLMTSAH